MATTFTLERERSVDRAWNEGPVLGGVPSDHQGNQQPPEA